jgi:hypothetical protein
VVTITATSVYDAAEGYSNLGTATATVVAQGDAVITSVEVTPQGRIVPRGWTVQFSAFVSGTGFASGTPQGVRWAITDATGTQEITIAGASINQQGLLTIASNVLGGTQITVRASSLHTPAIFGTATATVTAPPATDLPPPVVPGDPVQPPAAQLQAPPHFDSRDDDAQEDEAQDTEEMAPAYQLFDDISADAWYHDYVAIVAYHNLFQGTGYRAFSPYLNMTRAMFAQVLANLEDANLETYAVSASTFGDVAVDQWYFPAVQWAANEGIIFGVGEGNFAPNDPITREQMAVMLYRYAAMVDIALPTQATSPFVDQTVISNWAMDSVHVIQAAGIIRGRDDGNFDPRATAIRAEVAAIFARFLNI